MDIKNKSTYKYLSKVRRHLKCSSKTKERFLETLTTELHNFELDNPDASYDHYIAQLGDPKDTAKKYMDELSDKEVFNYWGSVIIVAVLIIIAVLGFMFHYFVTHIYDNDVPTYYNGKLVSSCDVEIDVQQDS